MFNESFWFFYWVSMVESLTAVGVVTAIILSVLTILRCMWLADDGEQEKIPSMLKRMIPLIISIVLIAVAIPPKEAFYAGGAQYVGETAELDDTLMHLKELVDSKIEDLSNENQ